MSVTASSNTGGGDQAPQTNTASGGGRDNVQATRNQSGRRNRGNRFARNERRGQGARGSVKSSFRGETPGLNGNVFQTLDESSDPTQFKRTIEALERFSNKVYQVDLRTLFDDDITQPIVFRPVRKTGEEADELYADEYREEVKEYVKEKKTMSKALRSLFSVIWGQCSVSVTTRLLALEDLQDWKEEGRVDELLKSIRQAMMSHQHKRCAYITLFRELRNFYSYRQRESQTLHKYLEVFQVQVENIKRYGGSFGNHVVYIRELMSRDDLDYSDIEEDSEIMSKYEDQASMKFLAIAFLLGGRVEIYGDLFTDLENDYLKGRDFFPDTVTEAYNLMSSYVPRKPLSNTNRAQIRQNGLGFLQTKAKSKGENSSPVPGTDGVLHERVQCYNCGQRGHYSHKCPVALLQEGTEPAEDIIGSKTDTVNTSESLDMSPGNDYMGFGFVQVSMFQSGARLSGIHKDWVLLDTQSNCDIFMNPTLLTNIRNNPTGNLILQSNGGEMEASQVGDIPGYGKVWFNDKSMANILSFANVRKKCKITLETGPGDRNPTIVVHRTSGSPMLFKEHKLGLYIHDTGASGSNFSSKLNTICDYSFLNTVTQLESTFTPDEIQKAKQVLTLSRKLGYPSAAVLKDNISNNKIKGCTLNMNDLNRSIFLYGAKSDAILKGKTIRFPPPAHNPGDLVPLPAHIRESQSSVTIYIDIFFVHGISFFHTISKLFRFRTVELLTSHTTRDMLSCLQNVINQYNARDLFVDHVFGDSEFLSLSTSILPTQLHICGRGDHVPTVERSIRTVKDRCRSIIHGLPYTHYTRLMIQSLVYFAVSRLNAFPCSVGFHPDHSPLTLVTGLSPPSMDQLSLEFGQYVQMHNNVSVPRSTQARTTGGIALLPANSNRSWYFLSLSTGKRVVRSRWTHCTITTDVISRVQDLAKEVVSTESLLSGSEGADEATTLDLAHDNDSTFNANVQNNHADAQPQEDENHANAQLQEDENANVLAEDENANEIAENEEDDDERLVTDNEESSVEDELEEDQPNNETTSDNEDAKEEERDADEKEQQDETSNVVNKFGTINNQTTQSTESDMEAKKSEKNEEEDDHQDDAHEKNRSEDLDDNHEENRSEEFSAQVPISDTEANESTSDKGIFNQNNIQHRINRYNLRKRIRKSKESRFNQTNYSYLLMKREAAEEKRKIKLFEDYQSGLINVIKRNNDNGTYNDEVFHRCAVGTCMTQMSARQGIKMYGERAIDAMAKEYSQLEELKVFEPIQKKKLTRELRRNALQVIDLIKEKRCGRIKGRTVVDGRGQRGNYSKSETSSSALTLEAFVATLTVDALENRDVAVADIAGAFLKADQPDHVVIKMRGPAVKAILRVNAQKYKQFIVLEKNEEVIYLKLLKAMYGTLTAPLLWYKMLARTLIELGFSINCYDPCVANKLVNGKQFTICWYVDDLKLSHVQSDEVTKMLEVLNQKFNQMTITRGKQHTYLGMQFEIKGGKISMNMESYLDECIKSFGEVIVSSAATPANKTLMQINDQSELLCDEKRETFHHIVQKLLHVCKRTRLDLQVVIGFLCTRVRHPTHQDWLKLRRVLQYVNGTKDLKRLISINDFGRIDIFIDASHGAHGDYRGQTGGCIKMGMGVLHGRSSKQGLNSKSSTETELIGVSDYMPYPIWLVNFYREQGYEIGKVVLQQDNESTIKMLTNGRKSCGPKSRHIGIRYFWCTDRLRTMKAEIVHCPTAHMLADFFTKPLQGKLFRLMRDVVHGLIPYNILIKANIEEKQQPNNCERKSKNVIEVDVSTDREERVGILKDKKKKPEVKRVRFIDGVETDVIEKKKTYAEITKGTLK